jgi:hypothetical protein
MDGSSVLGTVALSGGSASITLSSLTVGGHNITAVYSGDTNFLGSNAAIAQTVNQAATSTSLSSTVNPSSFGQNITFSASVTSGASSAITGSIAFMDGSTLLGTVALSNGSASISFSSFVVGGHTITATYSGDTNYAGSSATLTEVVNKAGTTTTLNSSQSSTTFGQTVTFTASVFAASGDPTGIVTFMDGSTVLGTGTLVNGVATFSTSSLAVGSHTITAIYGGDDSYNTSTSAPLTQTVVAVAATASISGRTLEDETGNGLSPDDTALGGVTVYLYRDANGNGVLDSGDGAAIASTLSNATGAYSFNNLPLDNYFVREVVPTNYIRTAPALSDNYGVTISAAGTLSGFDFDNFKKCTATITNVSFRITSCNGTTQTVTDLRGHTHQGDTVTVTFTLSGAGDEVTLVSYDAPTSTFDSNLAGQQSIYEVASQFFGPGVHTLTVHIPNNYFQIDFVKCEAIDHFGPSGSNIFYSAQGRLISADNAGTHSDVDDMAATTAFWGHLGQSLIKSFNLTSVDPSPTQLGNWLATNFSNVYGPGGAYNTTNKSNSAVASMFMTFYKDMTHHKTDAAMLATALNVYASTNGLGGGDADNYGFAPTDAGLAAATFNVGNNGAAFNVANNSTLSVWQLLQAANSKSSNDVLYNGVSSMLTMAYNMFEMINNSGGIS